MHRLYFGAKCSYSQTYRSVWFYKYASAPIFKWPFQSWMYAVWHGILWSDYFYNILQLKCLTGWQFTDVKSDRLSIVDKSIPCKSFKLFPVTLVYVLSTTSVVAEKDIIEECMSLLQHICEEKLLNALKCCSAFETKTFLLRVNYRRGALGHKTFVHK